MKVLVVYESMFGNTREIAEAVAEGLASGAKVTVADVAELRPRVPPDVDVVVVGGPTHAFSMSRRTTRSDAVKRGASDSDLAVGIRNWLGALPRGGHPQDFVAFDTRVDVHRLPGAASKAATKLASRLGFRMRTKPASFLVEGYEGPLLPGERDRAREWGRELAAELAD